MYQYYFNLLVLFVPILGIITLKTCYTPGLTRIFYIVLNYITYNKSSKHGNSYVLGKSQETRKTIRKEHVSINEVSGGDYSRKMDRSEEYLEIIQMNFKVHRFNPDETRLLCYD
jgi:hypothetical protein